MKPGGSWRRSWAIGLGLLALALNALVPVHLAFDLAEALGAAPGQHGIPAAAHSAEWRLLALLMGHRAGDGRSDHPDKDHGAVCPVYGALGTLAGCVLTAPAALSVPTLIAIATTLPVIEREAPAVPVAAYRSRAPPAV
jgi:hypothetical protein